MASSVRTVQAMFTQTSTTALHTLGNVTVDENGAMWMYVKASGAVTQYDYVKIDDDFTIASATTTLLPNTEPAMVGNAQGSAFATNEYGWVFRGPGVHTGRFLASCVQDVKIYTTGTAGSVDDSSTTLINGLKLITTIVGAGTASAFAAAPMTTVAA